MLFRYFLNEAGSSSMKKRKMSGTGTYGGEIHGLEPQTMTRSCHGRGSTIIQGLP